MNHIYRLSWNRALGLWVPVSELARSRRGGSSSGLVGGVFALSLLAASMDVAGLAYAGNLPSGGQIVSGSGAIEQAANSMTVRQHSPVLSLNWQNFDIDAGQAVNFVQPGASSIAVNRISGTSPSQIYGHLNANGQVWLINPNGVLFGKTSQVNVGGIVASTLDLDSSTLNASERRFSGSGQGSVIAQGRITAADGGYVALLGNQVSNQGVIRAQLGTVALGGGSAVTLTFNDNHLLHLQVDQSTLHNMAENRQLIVADGGQVVMAAGARQSLLASAVNNTGTVQAQRVAEHGGVITLLAGMDAGTVAVGGTLDASAPNGGNGGQIETSAAYLQLAPNARITAAAPHGAAGTWLVDPIDLTIDAAAAATISSTLDGGTSVTEQTTATSASGVGAQSPGQGDITINAPINWSNAAASLNLQAYHGITVNAPVSGAGGIALQAAGGDLVIASGASVSSGTQATLSTATRFINNSGAGALGSQWLLYSANPSQNMLGGVTPDFIQYNAPFHAAPAASGNGLLYSQAPTVSVSAITGAVSKVYDGTSSAPLTGANLAVSGLVNGDKITTATGSYASTNAEANIAVTSPSTAGAIKFADSNGIPVFGYGLAGAPVSANVGTITPAPITVQIVNNPTKVYNGTTTAALDSSNYQLLGFVSGQGATLAQAKSVAYDGADAGTHLVNATFASTNFVAQPGTNLSNYTLPVTGFGMGSITPAPVQITGLLGIGKVYDGSTAAAVDAGGAGIFGIIASDAELVRLDTSGGYGTFASANVGNNINITPGGFQLTGSKANNYQLAAPAGLRADITPKSLTIGGVTAYTKTYDGTTNATLDVSGATLNGVVAGDAATVSLFSGAYSAQFGQRNVGNNLAVAASGFGLQGSAAGNYSLAQPAGMVANITPAMLTISLKPNPTKTYDGSMGLTLGNADFTVTGFLPGESAAVAQSSASYATANAGTNIPVTAILQASDFTPGANTSLSNYSFAHTIGGITGTINPQQLYGQIVGNPTKVYDGNTGATLDASNYTLYGFVGADSATVTSTTAAFGSPNAGINPVTVTLTPADYLAGGATLLSNYILPSALSGYGQITRAQLAAGFIGVSIGGAGSASKVYDGSTTITLAPDMFTLSGFLNGDSATIKGSIAGQFADKNVSVQPAHLAWELRHA